MRQQSIWIWLREGQPVWRERWHSTLWGDLRLDTVHLTGCKCTVTETSTGKLLSPLDPHTSRIQEGIKDCSTSSNVFVPRFTKTDTGFPNHPQGRLCLLPPVQGSGLCSLTAAIWCLDAGTRIILSPKDNDTQSSSSQFSSFAWNHSAWTLYQLGLFQLAIGWASSNLLLEGLSSWSLKSFSFTFTQKNWLWWKLMILKYVN